MFLIFEGIIKSPVKLEHPENASFSIAVTVCGISIDCKFIHLEKAASPIEVTVAGIINFPSNPVHSINAWNPIDVTPFGILISPVSLLQK